jgi:acyl dehydratase
MVGGPQLPQELAPFRGVIEARLCQGAVAGLGDRGGPVRTLFEAGLVPPDVLTGMTLHLLASQPRRPRADGGAKRGAVSGGVWVREQVTYHAPMRVGEEVTISGESLRRFVRNGRRYGVTRSVTIGEEGRLLVSSCTTGLLSYRRDPALAEEEEGVPERDLGPPEVERGAAFANPCLERLRALEVGEVVETGPVLVTLEMMRWRDAGRNDNPIHTDPEVARREGLVAPIAGGSHVLAFLQAALMDAWGTEALLHGAHFDVRWVGQTRAENRIAARAEVTGVSSDELVCALEIRGEDRPVLLGTLSLPVGNGAA